MVRVHAFGGRAGGRVRVRAGGRGAPAEDGVALQEEDVRAGVLLPQPRGLEQQVVAPPVQPARQSAQLEAAAPDRARQIRVRLRQLAQLGGAIALRVPE